MIMFHSHTPHPNVTIDATQVDIGADDEARDALAHTVNGTYDVISDVIEFPTANNGTAAAGHGDWILRHTHHDGTHTYTAMTNEQFTNLYQTP